MEKKTDELHKMNNEQTKYNEIVAANLQIVDKASKLSIINYLIEEISTIIEEDELLIKVIHILLNSVRLDRGFYIHIDNNLNLVQKPAGFKRNKNKISDDKISGFKFNAEFINSVNENRKPQILSSKALFPNDDPFELLAIPLIIQNSLLYILVFDNKNSQLIIKEKNIEFYLNIARQAEITLTNIISSKSALNILANIPSNIVIFDKETLKISYVNPSYLNDNKTKINNVLGMNIIDLLGIPQYSKNLFLAQIKDLSTYKKSMHDLELQIGSKIIGYTLFLMPPGINSKEEIGMIMKDITKQKSFQEQIIRDEKLTALGTLASGVAHEINNPLYGIVGVAEVIVDEAESEELKELGREIIDFAMQCSDIVKDLSSYSRSIREEKPKEININEIIEETLRIISYSPDYVDIKIEKQFDEVPNIYAMGGEIRQIFMNIINNAVQAMKGKGLLKITSKYSDGYIANTIQDNGPGIPAGIISKIFDPFFTTKPTGSGTGIGLNIVYRLVQKYNGIVFVKSKAGQGTKFFLKFPAAGKDSF